MARRAYITVLGTGSNWGEPTLEVASIPHQFVQSYTVSDITGELGLEVESLDDFEAARDIRRSVEEHFASLDPRYADLVDEAFSLDVVVVEESPARTKAIGAVAGAGAIAMGYGVFGPWAIIAVPVGVFLLAAAPEAGGGFGEWVGSWFRRRTRETEAD